ncbi:hypothetical protein F5Y04DRAFT_277578 [Hypomontagnella monticulosa]|nr:hypothetical protein F5Y04DRAFT_277578 [Hypomontagnella monticulosa]
MAPFLLPTDPMSLVQTSLHQINTIRGTSSHYQAYNEPFANLQLLEANVRFFQTITSKFPTSDMASVPESFGMYYRLCCEWLRLIDNHMQCIIGPELSSKKHTALSTWYSGSQTRESMEGFADCVEQLRFIHSQFCLDSVLISTDRDRTPQLHDNLSDFRVLDEHIATIITSNQENDKVMAKYTRVRAIIDTGSDINLVRTDMVRRWGLDGKIKDVRDTRECLSLSGHIMQPRGEIELMWEMTTTIGDIRRMTGNFFVFDSLPIGFVLRKPFLRRETNATTRLVLGMVSTEWLSDSE